MSIRDRLGVFGQYVETKKGYFIDPTTKAVNDKAISTAAASVVAQDSKAYGILYDYIGGYEFERLSDDFFTNNQTGEEQKAALEKLQGENDKVIYIDSNGLPMVSKTQRDAAQAYMEERLRTQATTGIQEAEYRTKDSIDAKINLTKAQTNNLNASANDEGKPTETTGDVLADIITEKFTFE